MLERKTPILLRRGPMSGGINALWRYTWSADRGMLKATGKDDVTADFDALVLETLLDPDSPDIVEMLDGAARGIELTEPEREQIRTFRERLVALIERHNTTGHGVPSPAMQVERREVDDAA